MQENEHQVWLENEGYATDQGIKVGFDWDQGSLCGRRSKTGEAAKEKARIKEKYIRVRNMTIYKQNDHQ